MNYDDDRLQRALISRLQRQDTAAFYDDDWECTYGFDTDDGGRLRVRIAPGQVEVLDADGPADCRFACSRADAAAILEGSLNTVSALLQGRIQVDGDIGLAQRLHSFIRAQNYALAEAVR
jgi:putative sterol carrier protein